MMHLTSLNGILRLCRHRRSSHLDKVNEEVSELTMRGGNNR